MIFNLYNTAEAAEALSLSKKTLERMRFANWEEPSDIGKMT